MIPTFLSYNLVARDLTVSMNRAAEQTEIKRAADYFKENIGKVTTIDEFLDDYRLYSYAMKAYGLEDMTYARAFMKKVLESDLSDTNSYANKLTDKRYREFASAFQFTSGSKTPMTTRQLDEVIGLYDGAMASLDTRIASETNYFNAMATRVTSVDQFLADSRLRDYLLQSYGIKSGTEDRAFLRNVLVSDPADPASYYNTVVVANRTAAQATIDAHRPVLADIAARQLAIDEKAYYQTLRDGIITTQGQIADAEARLALPGADTVAIGKEIDTYTITLSQRFATYGQFAVADMEEQLAAMTEGSPEHTALEAKITQWSGEVTARWQIYTDTNRIKTLETQMVAPGADVPALEAEIAGLRAGIATANGSLFLTTADIDDTIAAKTAEIATFDGRLPALGAPTAALQRQLSTEINTAVAYIGNTEKYARIAADFRFNADGSVPPEGFQSLAELIGSNELYISSQERLTLTGATLNEKYFREKVNTFTTAADMLADTRIAKFLKEAFGMATELTVVTSTLENALTTPVTDADLQDPDNYLVRFHKGRPYFDKLVALARSFNFNTDGTLPAGKTPVDESNLKAIGDRYFSGYDDAYEEADANAVRRLKLDLFALTSADKNTVTVDDLLASDGIYSFAMKAVGLKTTEVTKRIMKQVLMSDLQDPKSFANSLKDERYLKFANLFNFDSSGKLASPMTAQSEGTMQQVAKDYIIQKTRFLEGDELTKAKAAAQTESTFYQQSITSISSLDQLLANRRVLDFAMTAKGIDPKSVTNETLKKIFHSDVNNPDSAVNQMDDYRFAELVSSFNFTPEGKVTRPNGNSIVNQSVMIETMNLYLRQTIEETQGAENGGVRLALYFERMAPGITSPYDILGDTALYEFFKVTFGLPAEIGGMPVDKQAALVEKYLDLRDLGDPDALSQLVKRFTALYDLQSSDTSSAASILLGGGSGDISADTMMALAQLNNFRR